METSFFTEEELKNVGFKSYGKNVLISRKASIYGASKMIIGDHVRIDDYCVLSGALEVGNYVHIAVFNAIFAGDIGVVLKDFVGVSSGCRIYAESDDFSGEHLTNPTVDKKYTKMNAGKVELGRHVLIGSGTTILPGVYIGEGTAVGTMSLVNKSLDSWGIYVGVPCKLKKKRSTKLTEKEREFLEG